MVKADSLIKQYGKFNLDVSLEVPDGYITVLSGRTEQARVQQSS